jgi:dipeptidase E
MSGAADVERVDVIDEQGRTVGTVTRREIRARHLPHRCVYLLVFNSCGELFVHLRTPTKDVYPSHWDVAVGGVLAAGEDFATGARRELREELGVDAEPEALFPFRYDDDYTGVRAMVYRVVHDGPFQLQAEEVVRGEFLPLDAVAERVVREPFCPDGVAVLRKYQGRATGAGQPGGSSLRMLLGSGGFRTEERVRLLGEQMRSFFGPVERLLFVPYALRDHDGYLEMLTEKGLTGGYVIDGIHRHADPERAMREAQALFVGGGNTFRLLAELYGRGLLGPIRERVRGGLPYLGISAGTNVACPTIKTTNDMPIALPPSLDALGLVPFQVNPHYFTGQVHVKREEGYQEHFSETRDDRIREFHEMNDTPVVGLWEGGLLRVEQGHVLLLGAPARVFRKGQEPLDLAPGTLLEGVLVG